MAKKLSLSGNKRTLFKNTLMLYIMQFSTYLLALLVAPYQTRVLGAEVYGGYLESSLAIILYFQMVIDFGFLLSATEEVSRKRDNKDELSKIFTSVTTCKVILSFVSFIILLLLCQIIPAWKEKELILILTFFSSLLTSLMPDFLYRGLERMSAITYRTVLIRVFFTAAMFVFLKKPEDVWVVPVLNIIGNGAALIAVYIHVTKKLGIVFRKIDLKHVLKEFSHSAFFFFSRIATTAYTALNTVILDIITHSGANTGYYTSANKLITAGKNGLSPIADSMYPYMAQHRDFKLVKKILLIFEPVIFIFCTIVFIWAPSLCAWFFGAEFRESGYVLRAMLPVAIVILPSYILGFPTLTAMGLSKHANYSTIFGSVIHIIMLGVLYFTNNINMMTLAYSVSITESVILLYRIIVILKNKKLMNPKED